MTIGIETVHKLRVHMTKHQRRVFIFLLVACALFLWLVKASIVSVYLSDKIGVPVTIRMISIWPKSTTLRYFRIANPERYRTNSALVAKKTEIGYRWGALTGTVREIDSIVLEDVFLNIYIQNITGKDNNWAEIGSRMSPPKNSREVMIHKLIIKNMTVKTEGPGAKKLGVAGLQHFDQMEFDSINSKDGFPTKALISQIFQKAGIIKYLENFLNPTQRVREILSPFQIFGRIEKKAPENQEP